MTLREYLTEAPFTLSLSSGFFGFFAHLGLARALEDSGLKPARITGASAGALVGASVASGLECARIGEALLSLKREQFWDPRPGFGLLKGRRFANLLRETLPVTTFESCPTPLGISAYDVLTRKTHVLERGDLISAVVASCAVPFLFHPVWINFRPYLDGGVKDGPGLAGTHESERVFHHHLANRIHPHQRTPPSLPQVTSLVIDGLPKLGPFALEKASQAYESALRAATKALSLEVNTSRLVRLSA